MWLVLKSMGIRTKKTSKHMTSPSKKCGLCCVQILWALEHSFERAILGENIPAYGMNPTAQPNLFPRQLSLSTGHHARFRPSLMEFKTGKRKRGKDNVLFLCDFNYGKWVTSCSRESPSKTRLCVILFPQTPSSTSLRECGNSDVEGHWSFKNKSGMGPSCGCTPEMITLTVRSRPL